MIRPWVLQLSKADQHSLSLHPDTLRYKVESRSLEVAWGAGSKGTVAVNMSCLKTVPSHPSNHCLLWTRTSPIHPGTGRWCPMCVKVVWTCSRAQCSCSAPYKHLGACK